MLLTLDERQTRRRHIVKLPSRTAAAVRDGMERIAAIYGDKFEQVFRSITGDNGAEFTQLTELLPKKQNSLIRRFFPKGHGFDDVSDAAIAAAEDRINRLPRKIFNDRSSADLFQSVLILVLGHRLRLLYCFCFFW